LSNNFFEHVEKVTNMKLEDLFQLTNSVAYENLHTEESIRELIAQLSVVANVEICKETEDQIIDAIMNNKLPLDAESLIKMLGKK